MTGLIRTAAAADETEWRRLWAGYLDFYETVVPAHVTNATWTRMLDPGSSMLGRVAEGDKGLLGFTISVVHPSTWSDRSIAYLEDLFVDPQDRSRGLGRALIDDLLELARQHGWSRLYWHTNAGNSVARRLYDRYCPADGFVRYRLFLD